MFSFIKHSLNVQNSYHSYTQNPTKTFSELLFNRFPSNEFHFKSSTISTEMQKTQKAFREITIPRTLYNYNGCDRNGCSFLRKKSS